MDQAGRFREVFESAKDSIYRICCCYLRDPEDRHDVFQEVALRLYRHIGSFRGESAPQTWVYRITVNTCLDFLRAEKRHGRILDRRCSDERGEPGDCGAGSERIARMLDVERLYAAVAQLPVIDRALVSLHLEDASTREIAAVMGISEVNVRVRLHRIRETLRQALGGNDDGTR